MMVLQMTRSKPEAAQEGKPGLVLSDRVAGGEERGRRRDEQGETESPPTNTLRAPRFTPGFPIPAIPPGSHTPSYRRTGVLSRSRLAALGDGGHRRPGNDDRQRLRAQIGAGRRVH